MSGDLDSQELFGLDLKKKKKKKKLDLSQLENEVENIAHAGNELPNDKPPEKPVESIPDGNDDPLDLSTRKKKKKKPLILDESIPIPSTDPALEPVPEQPVIPEPVQEVQVVDYELPPKKKRKRQNITFEGFDDIIDMVVQDVVDGDENEEDAIETMDSSPWAGNDRDYTYDELLERVFNIMKQKNPSMVDRKTKLVMKPPQVMRVGAKRTSFANFTEICKHLHRQPKHMLAFLMAELGTSGSVDGNNQLIIKGRFQQKQIETVLRRYIKEYVTCHTCRSPETILQRENRLVFLQCETCGSRCTVQSIQSGFQAITNKAQRRSKQQ